MRLLTRALYVPAMLLPAAYVASAGQVSPSPQQTVCGQVQRMTCEGKSPRFTTLVLKPKSKDLPVTILSTSRAQFIPTPEELYRDTEVCATGRVETAGRRRRLVVSGPADIAIRKRLKPPEPPWKNIHYRECDESVKMPVLIGQVRPTYTREAMKARIEGTVALEAIVGTDGMISEIRVRRSLDSEFGLDNEAIKVLWQWRFLPGTRFGRAAPVLVEIELTFRRTAY